MMVCWLKLIGKIWGLSELRLGLNKDKNRPPTDLVETESQ